jgi:hypothetical protein
MRAIVGGLVDLELNDLVNLEEPIPFELAQNFKNLILLAEPKQNIKPLLLEMQNFSRNGDKPSIRLLLEALLSTPKSLSAISIAQCDIKIKNQQDLIGQLIGNSFEVAMRNFLPSVVPGITREELFNGRIGRLLHACSSVTILDRYFATQMNQANYETTGAFWLLNKILESKVSNVEILSSNQDGRSKINLEDFKKRLVKVVSEVDHKIRIEGKLGYASHDRHISFNYSQGSGCESITLGAGADVFKNEILTEGFAVVRLDSKTAIGNERLLLDSYGKTFELSN